MPYNDPQKRRAQAAAWRAKNREQLREYARQRYRNSPKRRQQVAEQNKRWATENPEKRRASVRKWQAKNARAAWALQLSQYGITPEQYDSMLAAQGGHCAICPRTQQENVKRRRLAVDHDHVTGRVRGLLCYRCNVAIGHLDDEPARARAAAEYLER